MNINRTPFSRYALDNTGPTSTIIDYWSGQALRLHGRAATDFRRDLDAQGGDLDRAFGRLDVERSRFGFPVLEQVGAHG